MSNRLLPANGHSARTPYLILFGISVLALSIRLAPLLHQGVIMDPDSNRYIELAQGLRHGCGFARWVNDSCSTAIETLRTPGYPIFLAAMPSLRTAIAIQGIIGAAVSLLIGLFVWKFWGLTAGLVAELIVALDIPSILCGATIMSDVIFQALVTAAVVVDLLIVARGSNDRVAISGILLAAIALGSAVIVRPLGIVLPIFAGLPVFLLPRINWHRTISIALIAFAIPSLFVLTWMGRNQQRTGVWTLSTVGPLNLYYFRAAGVVWYRSERSFTSVQEEFGRNLGWPMQDFEEAPPSLLPTMTRRALQIMLNDPLASALMTLRCFGWLAIVPTRGSLDQFLDTKAGADSYLAASGNVIARIRQMLRSPLLTSLVALQFISIAFVWVGIAKAVVDLFHKSSLERKLILVPLSLTILFLALSSGPEAMARYRMPVVPMLAIMAAVGWFGRFRSTYKDASGTDSAEPI